MGRSPAAAERDNQASRAFLWNPDGSHRELGALPAAGQATGFGLNNQGEVVGEAGRRAFLWRDGVFYDLNDLVSSPPGWTFYTARAINDSGAIAASARKADGTYHAFLLTPIPR